MNKIIVFLFFCNFSLNAQQNVNGALHEEDREQYDKFFDIAGREFGVPSDLLRGLSFSETRWTHMKWDDKDSASACNGMPRVYGVMGLWNNEYFGFSLRDASVLIGKSPQELKESPLQNIRGAAALLKKYYNELPKPSDFDEQSLESWQNAIAKFSGFPQEDIAHQRGLEIYSILSTGYARDGILIPQQEIKIDEIKSFVRSIEERSFIKKKPNEAEESMSQPDYPLAKWNPARNGHWSTTLIQQKFVVVHDVEGSYLGCISWFQSPNNTYLTSAHYILNSHPNGVNATTKAPNNTPDAPVGEITQMVEERYRAHHVGCWNSYMIGIEHEGYASVSGWYTPECYDASSKLVKYLCDKYNIPKDRNHVIAHGEHQNVTWRNWVTSTGQGFDPTCNTHTDPGPFWTWTNFMGLVTQADTIRPVITTALPNSNLSAFPAYKSIVIEFNTQMDVTSTNAAFSIAPNVAGTKIWSADNKILTFDPTNLLPWNTQFTVKVDTSAKNVAKSRNLGTTPYIANFTAVPLDTVGPSVVRTYPIADENEVSVFADVAVSLDEPVLQSSLSTTVKMFDANGASVPLASAKNEIIMDRGIVSFTPLNLKPNSTYTVKFLAGLKDNYNNLSKTDVIFQFTTSPETYTAGIPLDNFESNTKGWLQPYQSILTKFTDSSNSSFTFTNEKFKSGANSARLMYKFSSIENGVVALQASGFPPIDMYSTVGIWIAGDASNSDVELQFSPNDQKLNIGKVYWRGWRFFQFPIAQITGPNKKLTTIIVHQDSGFTSEGKIYFDEMQLDAIVTNVRSYSNGTPNDFQLNQNYPNPFNPSTTFSFTIPQTTFTSLAIYDMLGRSVATVAYGQLNAGNHTMNFDASFLPSGVYFYKLSSGKFSDIRKMMLLK